jgi:mono/diheme cytochrome c family protein
MRQLLSRLRPLGLVLALGTAGCSKAPEQTVPVSGHENASASNDGESIFQSRCFVCHGREGEGDGPAAAGLGATVRDLTNPAWQDATSDETIRTVIRNGARAIGGSTAMAPNPDLSDEQIGSLVEYIRRLRK